jgi:uncharacterized heparinase superfamily protein
LVFRLRKRLRRAIVRARHRLGLPTLPVGRVSANSRFHHPIDASQREALIARYRSSFPDTTRRELQEAERLLAHCFHLLSHEMDHDASIAWSRDPVSGQNWSRAFSPDITYLGPGRLGDIKLPWELSKHQYFFTLGKAAWLTHNPVFAREIVSQIDQWITENPCYSGIHWISALEAGTRVLSWILAYPFFAECCDALFRERLLRSIAQHLLFVERNLSIGPFANTHLVGEAAVLVAGGLFLQSRHSHRWLARGLRHLNEQITRQVRADGAHVEQSVAYHRFFLDQYYLVDALLAANGASLPAGTRRVMESMTVFLMDMCFPDGTAPTFGDCDDARGIWCRADGPRDYRSLLALGALRFGRGDFKAAAAAPAEELLWLYGEQGLDTFQVLQERAPQHTSTDYPQAGYYVLRGGWAPTDSMLVFDCGPLGYGRGGHGHADALSFQLYSQGYRFLIDSGTYSYNLDYGWRDAFRATRAHNTVVVDGLDQSIMLDRMSWKSQARARCRRWITSSAFDLIDAEQDGYERLSDPVTHRRALFFLKPDTWLIWDQLTARQPHTLEWLLHVQPDCRFEPHGDEEAELALVSPSGARLWARLLLNDQRVEPEIRVGSEAERAAWYSPAYGAKEPSRVLALRCNFAAGQQSMLACFSSSTIGRARLDEICQQFRYQLNSTGY